MYLSRFGGCREDFIVCTLQFRLPERSIELPAKRPPRITLTETSASVTTQKTHSDKSKKQTSQRYAELLAFAPKQVKRQ